MNYTVVYKHRDPLPEDEEGVVEVYLVYVETPGVASKLGQARLAVKASEADMLEQANKDLEDGAHVLTSKDFQVLVVLAGHVQVVLQGWMLP